MSVERHLEHRGHAAGRGAPGAGFPTLPVGAAGLVEMHVRIDDARQDDEARSVDDFAAVADFATDGCDDSVSDGDIGGLLASWENYRTATYQEIGTRVRSHARSVGPMGHCASGAVNCRAHSSEWEQRGRGNSPYLLYKDLLCSFPESEPADLRQLFLSLSDRSKMIPSQLAHLAREQGRAVRKEQFGLADPPRIEQQHAGRGMAGVILEVEPQVALAHGNPGRLAAPAAVDYFGSERQHLANHGHGLGRVLLFQSRREDERSHADLEHAQH